MTFTHRTLFNSKVFDWNCYILLISFILYISNCYAYLSRGIIYFDDATTLRQTIQASLWSLEYLAIDLHMIAYNVLLFLWCLAFGNDLMMAKVLSMLIGAATIFVTFLFMKKNFPEQIAGIPPLLLSASPDFFHYIHQVRTYSLLILVSLICCYTFSGFAKRAKVSSYFFVGSILILPFIHFAGLLICVVCITSAALQKNMPLVKRLIGLQLVSFALLTPILWVLTSRYDLVKDIPNVYYWVLDGGISSLWTWLAETSRSPVALVINIALFAVALFAVRLRSKALLLLALWLIVPRICFYIYGELHAPVPFRRGTASMVLPFMMISGLSISYMIKKSSPVKVIGLSALFFLLTSYERHTLNTYFDGNMNLSEISNHTISPPQPILYYPAYFDLNIALMAAPDCLQTKHVPTCLKRRNITALNKKEDLEPLLDKENIMQLVVWDIEEDWIKKNFKPEGFELVYHKYVHIWKRRKP